MQHANICVKKGKTRVWICLMRTEIAGRQLRRGNHKPQVGRGPGVLELPLLPEKVLVPFRLHPSRKEPNLWLPERADRGREGAGLEALVATWASGDLTLVLLTSKPLFPLLVSIENDGAINK